MKKPNFTCLLPLLKTKEEFSLTETQYQESTGASLPRNTYYLVKQSALSKLARKYGFIILVNERTICLKKSTQT